MKVQSKLLLACIILFIGCLSETDPAKYVKHVNKRSSSYCESESRKGVSVTVCYRPAEFFAYRDMIADTSLVFSKANSRYKSTLFFTVNIKFERQNFGNTLLAHKGMGRYSEGVLQNTFGRLEDIFLVRGPDTIEVSTYNYERSWGISEADVFLCAFDLTKCKHKVRDYSLYVRDLLPEVGTIVIPLARVVKNEPINKG